MTHVKEISAIKDENEFEPFAHHPLQSWRWGEARRQMGISVVRFAEYENEDKIANTFQMTIHPLPLTSLRIGYIPRSVFPSINMQRYLVEYAKQNKLVFIKIEPYTPDEGDYSLVNNMQISPHPLFPQWTQILDLSPSEDILLQHMHHKTRYNIRLAEKKGVTVHEESTEKGFKDFVELYFETCKRQHYHGHDVTYHQIVWKNLKNGISHLLIAYYKSIPLAAYQLFVYKDSCYYVYGGTSILHRNLMASNLLMWEAVRFAKQKKLRFFDMWGSLPPGYDQGHEWAGFTRFKEGYGTAFVKMKPSYDIVVNPLIYRIYNTAYSLRQTYLSLR